ncbi:MAG: 30S ribosomal protein S20 [Patescibacteria group bacterium]
MPLLKSALKAMRRDRKKTARNRVQKNKMHDSIKLVEKLAKAKDTAKIGEALKSAYKTIDKAAKRNLLHKKTAARRKSQVAKMAKSATKKA